MQIKVDCYCGYRGEETPRRFYLGNNIIEIKEISDRRLAPDHRYFKIIGDDGNLYILRHDIETWGWELTFYKSGDLMQQLIFYRKTG